MKPLAAMAGLLLAGCATIAPPAPADSFMAAIAQHCGKAYEGRVVSNDPADADFAGKRLVMHVRDCRADEVRIPFHVGDDRSRTWVVTRTANGVRLKHDHRHADGTSDVLTMYGGETADTGSASRQAFPVDAESIALFRREKREVSVTNVWAMEIHPRMFAYELRRPPMLGGRFFRVEFDLVRPVPPPPPPWGS
ncbi:hypothetical protein [Sphingomonas mesophila]|uniref:hypothetical protein n=1 Tax=Sphingomonas mesophila TaxID=2303576 RepID=UPI000E57A722|nr:hypothetical protein [Sphingomonas mesophila]